MKIKTLATLILVVIITLSFALNNDLFINSNVTSAVSSLSQSDSSDCDWPMFGRTPEGNRVAPDGCGPRTDSIIKKWVFNAVNAIYSSPVVIGKYIIIATEKGSVFCLDKYDSTVIWKINLNVDIFSNIAIYKNLLIVPTKKGNLISLNIYDGSKVSEFNTKVSYSISNAPTIHSNNVYTAIKDSSNDYYFASINIENNNIEWKVNIDKSLDSSFLTTPLVLEDKVIVCLGGYTLEKIFCFERLNGNIIWSKSFNGVESRTSLPVYYDGYFYFCSYYGKNGGIYKINVSDGSIIWNVNNPCTITSTPILFNDKLYVTASGIYCYDLAKGDLLWVQNTQVNFYITSPILSNSRFYQGCADNSFCSYDLNGKLISKFETNSRVQASITSSSNNIYIATLDGTFYCFGDSENSNPSQDDDRSGGCDWPMFGRTPEGNRVAPDGCGPKTDKLELKWKFKTGMVVAGYAAVSKNKVFFGSFDRKLYCLDLSNGSKIWDYDSGVGFVSFPASSNGKIYFVSQKLYCLDEKSGKKLWEFKFSSKYVGRGAPTISDNKIYIGSDDGNMYCLSCDSGEKIWEYKTGYATGSSATISNGKVYFGSGDSKLYCLTAENGQKIWEFETGDEITSTPAISNNKVYFGSSDKKFYCLNAENGKKVWEYETGGSITFTSCPAISNTNVLIGSNDRILYCLDSNSGKKIWQFQTHNKNLYNYISSPAIFNDKVFIGSENGYLYCLSMSNGEKIWEFMAGRESVSSPVISYGKLIFGSYDSRAIFCFGDADESAGGSGGSGGSSGNAQPSCCDNCNDCDKCMVFKIGSKDWKICRENQPPMSAAPVVFKGKTFLVVKYIADSIGATVGWDAANQIVKLSNPQTNKTIFLQIGNHKALVNDEEVQIDANPDIKPFISGGRTLLPLRFIADNLGLQVTWVDKTKEAIICFKNPECAPGIDFELNDTEGKSYKLSDYRGKPVLIDFSTSWCGFCIKAMPALLSLHKRYDGRIQFFTVDPGEDTDTVRQFRDELGVSWPFLVDLDESVRKSLNITGYPTMLLLNGKSQIVYIQDGYNPDIEKILGDQFDKLLAK